MLASITSSYQIHPLSSMNDSKIPDPNKTMYLKIDGKKSSKRKKKSKRDMRKPSILDRDMD